MKVKNISKNKKFNNLNDTELQDVTGGGGLSWGGLLTAYGLGYAAGETFYNLTH